MLALPKHTDAVAVEDAMLRELPDGWVMTTLGEACLINPRFFTEPVEDDRELSFLPMAAVEAGTGRIDLSRTRLFADVRKGYTRFSEGDVLFAKITPCMENGKIAVAKGLTNNCGCGSTEFHVLRPVKGVSGDFLLFFLFQDTFRREAQGHMAGTAGQLRVPVGFLEEALLALPPLPEQRRIVAEVEKHFTRLDASVAALKRIQANLNRYRASVLKAACEGRLVPTEAELARAEERDYEPADRLLERILAERRARWESQENRRGKYKEPVAPDTSGLPELPKGWVWTTLAQISDLKGGATKGRRYRAGELLTEVPYLRVANVQRGYFDLSEIKMIKVTQDVADQLELVSGDILFTEGGDRDKLGRGWVWKGEIDGCIHQNHVFRSRLLLSEVHPEFVSWWGNSFGQTFFEQSGKQTTNLASINLSVLSGFPVPLPPLSEQHRIVAEVERRLSVIQQAEAAVEANLRKAERLRQSILKQAFSGRLVPQDPSDEPASVLLERIRAEREAAESAAKPKRRAKRRRAGSSPEKQPVLLEGAS